MFSDSEGQHPERIHEALHRIYSDLAAESRAVELYTGQMAALRSKNLRLSVAGMIAEEKERLEQLSLLARELLRLLPTVERRGISTSGSRAAAASGPARWALRAAGWVLGCLGLRTLATVNARSKTDSARSYTAVADQFDWNFPRAANAYRAMARAEERHARWFESLLERRSRR